MCPLGGSRTFSIYSHAKKKHSVQRTEAVTSVNICVVQNFQTKTNHIREAETETIFICFLSHKKMIKILLKKKKYLDVTLSFLRCTTTPSIN